MPSRYQRTDYSAVHRDSDASGEMFIPPEAARNEKKCREMNDIFLPSPAGCDPSWAGMLQCRHFHGSLHPVSSLELPAPQLLIAFCLAFAGSADAGRRSGLQDLRPRGAVSPIRPAAPQGHSSRHVTDDSLVGPAWTPDGGHARAWDAGRIRRAGAGLGRQRRALPAGQSGVNRKWKGQH